MSKSVKNQHYIPQFYLRRFADENGRFCVYDVKNKNLLTRQHPRNFASARYFYDTDSETLQNILEESFLFYPELRNQIDLSNSQFVEHYLAIREAEASKAITEIESNADALWNDDNQQKIINFLYDLSVRTEFVRKQYEYINDTLNNHLDKMNYPTKDKHKKHDDKELQLKQIFNVSKLQRITYMLKENYDWFVGYNDSSVNFFVGDNPIYGISIGFNDICFPMSLKKSIILRAKRHNGYIFSKDESTDGKTIDLSCNSILIYNCIQIKRSYRYCFGDKNTFLLTNKINELLGIDLTTLRSF